MKLSSDRGMALWVFSHPALNLFAAKQPPSNPQILGNLRGMPLSTPTAARTRQALGRLPLQRVCRKGYYARTSKAFDGEIQNSRYLLLTSMGPLAEPVTAPFSQTCLNKSHV